MGLRKVGTLQFKRRMTGNAAPFREGSRPICRATPPTMHGLDRRRRRTPLAQGRRSRVQVKELKGRIPVDIEPGLARGLQQRGGGTEWFGRTRGTTLPRSMAVR